MFTLLLVLSLADSPSVPDRVVEYARSQIGKKVGDGECTTLAVQALRRSGAKRPDPRRGVWGDDVPSLKDVQPGDILQFEDVVFFKRRRRADGAILTQTLTFPHHTAIIVKVQGKGSRRVLTILHQNTGMDGDDEESRRVVKEGTLDLATLRSGSLHAYRPAAERVSEDRPMDRPSPRTSTPARDEER